MKSLQNIIGTKGEEIHSFNEVIRLDMDKGFLVIGSPMAGSLSDKVAIFMDSNNCDLTNLYGPLKFNRRKIRKET